MRPPDLKQNEDIDQTRESVRRLCADFPNTYWQELDHESACPAAFAKTLSDAGFLSALIPEAFGGSGLPISAAAAIPDEIQHAGANCGAYHAQMRASETSWVAAGACVQPFGGFAFAEEYDVERKFRETRLYQVAPISTTLIFGYVGEHVSGMARSY